MEWYEVLGQNIEAMRVYSPDAVTPIERATPAGLEWRETREGLTAKYRGRWLASRRAPTAEAHRLAESVDIMENAVVVVPGFGLGYHVEAICRRMQCYGAILVFEPDVGMMQEVLSRIDHSGWLGKYNVMVLTDVEQVRGCLSPVLMACAIGVTNMVHPGNAARLSDELPEFFERLKEEATNSRMTVVTAVALERISVSNALMNIDRYVTSQGISDLHGWFDQGKVARPQDGATAPPAVEAVGGPCTD